MRGTIPSLPRSMTWPGGAAVAQERARWLTPPRFWSARRSWLAAAAGLVAVGCFCALVQGPQWRQSAVLATANLAMSLVFVLTGLLLGREPGQRVTAGALMLAGVFRSLDFIDAWNGPWPAYTTVFGGIDRIFGAWALLRYPDSSMSGRHRRYLVLLTGWMLGGRTLIAVTSTARWSGYPPSTWWPTLLANQQLSETLNYVIHVGEGLGGIALIAFLVIRLMRTRGLDRIVITPIAVAGIAAVIATIASTIMMALSLSGTPNDAYLTESLVDLGIPVAFLGLGTYVAMTALNSPWGWRAKNYWIHVARFVFAIVAMCFVLWLITAELVIIDNLCLYCTGVHVVTFALLIVLTRVSPAQLGWVHSRTE